MPVGPLEAGVLLVIVAVPLAFAYLAHGLAKRKGRDGLRWAVLTLVFLPAILVLALLPRVERERPPGYAG